MRASIAAVVTIAASLVLAASSVSLAGTPPDPDVGDTELGIIDGIRYASELVEIPVGGPAFPLVGCGADETYKLISGGSRGGEDSTLFWIGSQAFRAYPPEELSADDGFESEIYGPAGGDVWGFSVCIQNAVTKVVSATIPAQATGKRTGAVFCGPPKWRATGGAIFIATSGASVGNSRPGDGTDVDTIPDDGWKGTAWDTAGGAGGMSVYAGCLARRSVRYVQGPAGSVPPMASIGVRAACLQSEHVIGGGQTISGAVSGVRVVASYPFDTADADLIPDDAWQVRVMNQSATTRTVRAWAVCLAT